MRRSVMGKRLRAALGEIGYNVRYLITVRRVMWRDRDVRPCRQKYRRIDREIRKAMRT